MLYFELLGLLAVVGYFSAIQARARTANSSRHQTAWRVGGVIALLRISVFLAASRLYVLGEGRDVVGYVLMVTDALWEMVLGVKLLGETPPPQELTVALIFASSVAIGYVWAWLRHRTSTQDG